MLPALNVTKTSSTLIYDTCCCCNWFKTFSTHVSVNPDVWSFLLLLPQRKEMLTHYSKFLFQMNNYPRYSWNSDTILDCTETMKSCYSKFNIDILNESSSCFSKVCSHPVMWSFNRYCKFLICTQCTIFIFSHLIRTPYHHHGSAIHYFRK